MALGQIKCHIVPSYLDVVANCTSAIDAWKKIEEFFAGKETFHKIHLLEQLIDGKLKETSNPEKDVQEFVTEKNELVRRLDAAGLKICEEIQVAIMLARLPSSYDVMRRILESSPNLSLLQLTAQLNHEAARKLKKRPASTLETALAAQDADEPSSYPRPVKKKKLRTNRSRCNYCNKEGHLAENCWLNPDSVQFKPEIHQQMLDIAARTSAIQEQRTRQR